MVVTSLWIILSPPSPPACTGNTQGSSPCTGLTADHFIVNLTSQNKFRVQLIPKVSKQHNLTILELDASHDVLPHNNIYRTVITSVNSIGSVEADGMIQTSKPQINIRCTPAASFHGSSWGHGFKGYPSEICGGPGGRTYGHIVLWQPVLSLYSLQSYGRIPNYRVTLVIGCSVLKCHTPMSRI